MNLTEKQKIEFDELASPLMDWMVKNMHPHMSVILDSATAELLEGVRAIERNPKVQHSEEG